MQHDSGNEEFDVDQGHTVHEIGQSFAHRKAELLFFEELAELRGDGFGDFVGDHFQSSGESMAGANRSGQGINRLRKQFLELIEALGPLVRGERIG